MGNRDLKREHGARKERPSIESPRDLPEDPIEQMMTSECPNSYYCDERQQHSVCTSRQAYSIMFI